MDEFGLIARYFRPLAGAAALHLADDAALLPAPDGYSYTITTDTIIEGVHFLANTPAALVAAKALRVNLSDLAAMGATPVGYSLALSLNNRTDEAWLADFSAALQQEQKLFNIELLGGDTTRSNGPLTLSINAIGKVKTGQALLRRTAQVGDIIYVTGTIGDAYLGLKVAQGNLSLGRHSPNRNAILGESSIDMDRPRVSNETQAMTEHFLHRYHTPQPRLSVAQQLYGVGVRCCMDISDGLLADARHIASTSQVAIQLNSPSIPYSVATQHYLETGLTTTKKLWAGGDDYELLFTAPAHIVIPQQIEGIPITPIGKIVPADTVIEMVEVFDDMGKKIAIQHWGYNHINT